MSTVMYCYRIKRTDWWDLTKSVRKLYEECHTIAYILRAVNEKGLTQEQQMELRSDLLKMRNWESDTVDIQLFEEDDEHYLFRVLEHGYTFMNHYQKEEWPIEPVFYDNRVDTPPEWEPNAAIVGVMDAKIEAREYFVWPVVSDDDIFRWIWGWRLPE